MSEREREREEKNRDLNCLPCERVATSLCACRCTGVKCTTLHHAQHACVFPARRSRPPSNINTHSIYQIIASVNVLVTRSTLVYQTVN